MDNPAKNYHLRLEFSFIITLIILIATFYFINKKYVHIYSKNLPYEPSINIISYTQGTRTFRFKQKPLKPLIPVPIEEVGMLDIIKINEIKRDSSELSYNQNLYIPYSNLSLVFDNEYQYLKNYIFISFKVGADGYIKDYKIIREEHVDSVFVKNVINKSKTKFYGIMFDHGTPCEYWKNEVFVSEK